MTGAYALGAALLASTLAFQPAGKAASEEGVHFEKHVLTRDFISEGVAVTDVNRDGHPDVVAGAYWFEAPTWAPHEISEPQVFSPAEEYSDSFLNFALDVNLDGWPDVIRIGLPGTPAYWFENPKGRPGPWKRRTIYSSAHNESPRFADMDGDGRRDLVFATVGGQMVWFQAPTTNEEKGWSRYPISDKGAPGTQRFSHGLGIGDLNDDGRKDVVVTKGWWEAPPDPHTPNWTFHAADLGAPAAQMYVHDFDRDGDKDVAASSAHNYGLWWYEQKRQSSKDASTWGRHLIYDRFSQSHALAFADVNADGQPDLVTGKRYFAHNGKDPGGHEPAVLYWFEFVRDEQGQPSWRPHKIDDNSGVGLHVVVQDVVGGSQVDIAVANKKGVFVFEQVER